MCSEIDILCMGMSTGSELPSVALIGLMISCAKYCFQLGVELCARNGDCKVSTPVYQRHIDRFDMRFEIPTEQVNLSVLKQSHLLPA